MNEKAQTPDYAELHCLSAFSFQRGASTAKELFERAYEAAREFELPLIVGSEVRIESRPTLVLLAADLEGYIALSRLITLARRRAAKGEYRSLREDFVDLPAGLLALWAPSRQPSDTDAVWLCERFAQRLRISVELHRSADDAERLAMLRALGERHGLPLVAAGDVHMHVRRRRALQDTLTAVRHHTTIANAGWRLFPNGERHLRTREALAAIYPAEMLAETLRIAKRCQFSLDQLRYTYPHELVPEGHTATTWLRRLTEDGARWRWPAGAPARARELIEHELALIAELHYESYFLTVHDIVRFAREHGILCQGRGSAANSAVCYALGVTGLDPGRMNLLFERFLSRERNEPPDIDIDFEHERREEVLQYVFDRYGRDRAAMTAVANSYRGRSAVRDVAKALGLPPDQVDRLASTMDRWGGHAPMPGYLREQGFDPDTPILQRVIALTSQLMDFPRHLSQHPGGMVISEYPLHTLVPTENAAMQGRTVLQWDKDDLDTLGLMKVDCLALGMLTAVRKTLDVLRATGRHDLSIATIPAEDPATYAMICKADTVGVFQIESRAQIAMLPRLKPTCFYDLVIEVAIVRPGPIQGDMVHPYLRRRRGEEPIDYPPKLKHVFERTLGVPLFQEQVMQVAVDAAGFTPGEADQLRRSMAAWKRRGGLEPHREKLLAGMMERGYSREYAEQTFERIKGFGSYGFPESHAASSALVTYASCWLKCHEPAAFAVSLINSQPMGFYTPDQILQDVRRKGIRVLPVDVRYSDWDCTLEFDSGDTRGKPAVRLGLRLVSGFSQDAAERITSARTRQSFRDVADLCHRATLDRRHQALLAESGASKGLSGHRHRARWAIAGVETPLPLFDGISQTTEPSVPIPLPSVGEDVVADYASIGLTLGHHPLQLPAGSQSFVRTPHRVCRRLPLQRSKVPIFAGQSIRDMTTFPLNDALKPAQWRDNFDKRSLTRANDYLRRVSKIAYVDEGDAATLEAHVKGSASSPYETSVRIECIDDGLYAYTSECSCPVGWGCKHGAALLMVASQQFVPAAGLPAPRERPAPAPEWKAWMGALTTAPALPMMAPAPTEKEMRQIAVVLDVIDTQTPKQLVAKLVWVQKTRQGRWSKQAPIRVDGLGNDLDTGQLTAPWHDRLARLQLRPPIWHGRHQHMHPLKGTHAEALLDELLNAGVPCFWQKPTGGEIRPGPERTLQWHWHTNEDGVQRLQVQGCLLLQVDGYWLLDPHTLILHRLAGSHDAAMIGALLRIPAIPPEESAGFAEQMCTHPALSALPAPQVIGIAAPIETMPTPVLRLLQIPLQASGWTRDPNKHLPCVRLEFDYDGHRLPGPPSTQDLRRIHNGALQWVRRNRLHEEAAQAVLTGADLHPIRAHYGLQYRVTNANTTHEYIAGRLGNPEYDPAALLQKVLALSPRGFRIETDPSFPLTLGGTPDGWYATVDDSASGIAWFDVELGIELDGERISLLPILHKALEQRSFNLFSAPPGEPPDAVWHVILPDGRVVALPLAKLRTLAAPLLQWLDGGDQTLRVPRVAAALLDDLSEAAQLQLRGKTATGLRNLASELRQSRDRRPVAVPRTLKASLRPYQRDGLTWLDTLARTGLGGVLADDMGLGKTMQMLGHLLKEREAGRLDLPALVVCPTSVVGNWQEQAARFAPVLRVRTIHGSARHEEYDALDTCDLAITTYALLPRDREILLKQQFSLAIFDEAQALKNASSQATQVARCLPARRKIAVTGTPLENHLGELWSQFECVLPGLLGDSKSFTKHFRTPIEKHNDETRQTLLNRRTAPFMLRRTKGQVAQDLPAKTDILQTLELGGKQRELYETLRLSMHEKVREAVKKRGLAQSSIIILDALLKLRQACCDPRLIKIDAARKVKESAKLDALLSMIDSLLSEGRKILLFSQFTGMLDLIEDALRTRGIEWIRLDGSSRNRTQLVQRFQSGEAPLFLISLKAGGVGLNLTAADTVIHYDPWWNPAVEAQATDRAHRIGQTQPVFVYKLICTGTVEEKILALQQRKGDLARAVLEGGTRTKLTFDEADIEALFAPM